MLMTRIMVMSTMMRVFTHNDGDYDDADDDDDEDDGDDDPDDVGDIDDMYDEAGMMITS